MSKDKIVRLPKGHRVICAIPINADTKKYYSDRGISWAEDDEKMFIEAFVSGDTAELGLSVVALDNPKHCMYHSNNPEDLDRANISNGYDNWWMVSFGIGSPSCPY